MVLYYSPVQSPNQTVRYYATSTGGLTPILEKVFTPVAGTENAYTVPGTDFAISETTMYAVVGLVAGAAAMFLLTRKK